MGQCVSIEVNAGKKNASHSAIHQHHDSQKALHPKDKQIKNKKLKKDESSDEETSDDAADIEREALENFAHDENFGKAQSPINVITAKGQPNCYDELSSEEFKSNPLKINYPDEVRGCTILNTGHTVQVNIPEHSKCTLNRNGKTYHLKQFHFHTPSEHMIDSKQYEMEMHLVHISEAGEIAVLGFIFTTKVPYFVRNMKLAKAREFLVKKTQEIIMNYGKVEEEDPVHQHDHDHDHEHDHEEEEEAADDDAVATPGLADMNADERRRSSVRQLEGNDFLDQFWDQLPMKKTTEDILLNNAISFDYLFEAASKTFKKSVETNEITIDMEIFEYDGSLTTPPYTEGVQWMLARGLHFINAKQLNKLSSCWGHHPNARECQHYCGRKVVQRTGADLKGYFFN